ncbi:polyprenyl synthetase family protein [Microbacterium sp. MEC084]|uniref:polyprenyl synthetase family protein n=1 Tax=Microbacterium sp. MEC084 TaxID=1963027 RepID=UPI00107028D4|nr:polyprenyl synthetase family protein [Microbacterium sp. MEC084]MCD1268378.1 polyprenyl synthetase family protein [Microbacterium sp. MEC084]
MAKPSIPGSRIASRFGLSERVFAGPGAKKLIATIEDGLEAVERQLAEELRSTDRLVDATSRYLYEAGGKRVRPMLTMLSAQLGDGAIPAVIDAATALELTHLGSLYHDDVMDGADRRRGVASAHQVWGNSIAILTGDLLFSRASQIMARLGERAMALQADTFERLVLGQMHETVGAQPGDDPIEFYIQVLADKTGSLIAASAQAGAIFANADESYREPLRVYGEKVGVAFQLLDDVIDLSADPAETGKVPGTDLRAGVPTMPYLLLAEDGGADARSLTERIDEGVDRIAAGEDPAILDEPLAALRDHEATARTRELALTWTREAIEALAPLPRGGVREALTRFAESLVDRSS